MFVFGSILGKSKKGLRDLALFSARAPSLCPSLGRSGIFP